MPRPNPNAAPAETVKTSLVSQPAPSSAGDPRLHQASNPGVVYDAKSGDSK